MVWIRSVRGCVIWFGVLWLIYKSLFKIYYLNIIKRGDLVLLLRYCKGKCQKGDVFKTTSDVFKATRLQKNVNIVLV